MSEKEHHPQSDLTPAPASMGRSSDDVKYSSGNSDKVGKPAEYPMRGKSMTDEESGNVGNISRGDDEEGTSKFKETWDKWLRHVFHFLHWCLWTIWWAYGTAVYYRRLTWLIPFLLWLAITIRIVTLYIPARYALRVLQTIWKFTALPVYNAVPAKFHKPLATLITVAVFIIGAMVSEEDGENTRGRRGQALFGLVFMIAIMTASSKNWRIIPWHTVIGGMLTQFVIAVFVLRTQVGYDIFAFISFLARTLLGFANEGVVFLTAKSVPELKWFFTGVIPAIIFFVALVSLLYHIGLIQWFVGKFAIFFFWSLRVSGAEAVVAAATPFIGQGESAMLIKPFVPHLTMAELHQVMTCGFATIAGSVLVAYISMGLNAQALVSSCIMSIPASLAISKMRYPEKDEPLTAGRAVVPEDDDNKAANALHAFANGAWLGLKIAGMIVSTLLCIIAFVGLINGFLGWWASYWGMIETKLTLQLILGYLFYPVSWMLGVPNEDLLPVGELIGIKIIVNEFAAFDALVDETKRYVLMTDRSKLIATYACCGFGNIGSLGTQIGVLSQIAPGRSADVSRVAVSALISGIIATLTSAAVAGMLATEGIIQSTLA